MRPTIVRDHLDNGLSVIVVPDTAARRVGVCVSYRVGYRDDPVGRSGMAHLVEHLMFGPTAGSVHTDHHADVSEAGGATNAQTFADTTEYFTVIPPVALNLVLSREARRMESCVITADTIAAQMPGLESEILTRRSIPLDDLPWPAMARFFADWPNGHDGLGVMSELRSCPTDDVRAFYEQHYAPRRAVLAITGAVSPQEVIAQVHTTFGDVPNRGSGRPGVSLGGSWTPARDTVQRPGISRGYSYAAGLLPDPAEHPEQYDACVVLARLITRLAEDGELDSVVSSAGAVGSWRTRGPDLFVISGPSAHRGSAHAEEVYRGLLSGIHGRADLRQLVRRAGEDVAARLSRELADSLEAARYLARSQNLFGDAGHIWQRACDISKVPASAVAASAAMLADAPSAILCVVPDGPDGGDRSTGPLLRGATAEDMDRPEGGPPSGQPPRGERLHGLREPAGMPPRAPLASAPVGEAHVIALHDPRTDHVEVRLSSTFSWCWLTRPFVPRALAALCRSYVDSRVDVTYDGEALMLSTVLAGQDVPGWLQHVVQVLTSLDPAITGRRTLAVRRPGPEELSDDVLRAILLTEAGVAPPDVSSPAFAGQPLLVLIGDVSTVDVDLLQQSLATLSGPAPSAGTCTWGDEPDDLAVPGVTGMVTLYSLSPTRDVLAGQIAAAMLAGWPGARLTHTVTSRVGDGIAIRAGVDRVLGRDRTFIRIYGPDVLLRAAVESTLGILWTATDGHLRDDAEPARRFVALNSLTAFDSPAALADIVVSYVRGGFDVGQVLDMPSRLLDVEASSILAAVGAFASGPLHQIAGPA